MAWGRRTTQRRDLVIINLGRGENKYKKIDATIKTGGNVKGSVWMSCGVWYVAKLILSIIYASFMDRVSRFTTVCLYQFMYFRRVESGNPMSNITCSICICFVLVF